MLTIRHICIWVMRLDKHSVLIQDCKPVDDVSADIGVDVFWVKLAVPALSVGGPVGEVADNLVVS